MVRDLPRYPIVEKCEGVKRMPKVAPATVCGVRAVEITKSDQRKEHCIEAALFELDQKTCLLFNQYGISQYFEAFRASVRGPLFFEYVRLTVGNTQVKRSVPNFSALSPNKPVDSDLQRLQGAFAIWERSYCICSLLTRLLDATCLKEKSSWAVGHFVLTKKNLVPYLFYIGSAKPKLLFLIDCSQKHQATLVVLGATAYPEPLSLGSVPVAMQTIHNAGVLSF